MNNTGALTLALRTDIPDPEGIAGEDAFFHCRQALNFVHNHRKSLSDAEVQETLRRVSLFAAKAAGLDTSPPQPAPEPPAPAIVPETVPETMDRLRMALRGHMDGCKTIPERWSRFYWDLDDMCDLWEQDAWYSRQENPEADLVKKRGPGRPRKIAA